jgi:hypothetical protein
MTGNDQPDEYNFAAGDATPQEPREMREDTDRDGDVAVPADDLTGSLKDSVGDMASRPEDEHDR